MLAVIEGLERSIAHVELEIRGRLRPFEQTLERVDLIPGVSQHVLEVLFAEVGWKMDPFPDAAHLASWAGMCPGQKKSAGKQLGGRVRKGNKWRRRCSGASGTFGCSHADLSGRAVSSAQKTTGE